MLNQIWRKGRREGTRCNFFIPLTLGLLAYISKITMHLMVDSIGSEEEISIQIPGSNTSNTEKLLRPPTLFSAHLEQWTPHFLLNAIFNF